MFSKKIVKEERIGGVGVWVFLVREVFFDLILFVFFYFLDVEVILWGVWVVFYY